MTRVPGERQINDDLVCVIRYDMILLPQHGSGSIPRALALLAGLSLARPVHNALSMLTTHSMVQTSAIHIIGNIENINHFSTNQHKYYSGSTNLSYTARL